MERVHSHTYRLKANARRNKTKTNPMPASNKSSRDEQKKNRCGKSKKRERILTMHCRIQREGKMEFRNKWLI